VFYCTYVTLKTILKTQSNFYSAQQQVTEDNQYNSVLNDSPSCCHMWYRKELRSVT